MLRYITSLSASGLRDWFIQRVTAVLLAAYTLLIFGFLLTHHPLHYTQWQGLFTLSWMRVFTVFTVFSLLFHAWIGLWIVSTDYIKKPCIRMGFQLFVIFALLACLLASILIVWGS